MGDSVRWGRWGGQREREEQWGPGRGVGESHMLDSNIAFWPCELLMGENAAVAGVLWITAAVTNISSRGSVAQEIPESLEAITSSYQPLHSQCMYM